MCLTKIATAYDKPSELIECGWKEFYGSAVSLLRFCNFGGDVPMDKWITASEIKTPPTGGIKASDGKMYKSGFHIYSDETQIKKNRDYRRVYYRRVTCAGEQDGMRCVIAQEMYVPSNQDSWPPKPAPPPAVSSKGPKPKAPKKSLAGRIKNLVS